MYLSPDPGYQQSTLSNRDRLLQETMATIASFRFIFNPTHWPEKYLNRKAFFLAVITTSLTKFQSQASRIESNGLGPLAHGWSRNDQSVGSARW